MIMTRLDLYKEILLFEELIYNRVTKILKAKKIMFSNIKEGLFFDLDKVRVLVYVSYNSNETFSESISLKLLEMSDDEFENCITMITELEFEKNRKKE